MSDGYMNYVNEDARLRILQVLAQNPSYTMSHRVLGSSLKQLGHTLSADAVITHIYWLKEQGLVTVTEEGQFVLPRLTDRGLDVGAGSARAPGVARPRPGE